MLYTVQRDQSHECLTKSHSPVREQVDEVRDVSFVFELEEGQPVVELHDEGDDVVG